MRIAFTGKGGSGKSTVSALFIEHLQQAQQNVIAIDADINVHLASLLGVACEQDLALSASQNVAEIRTHLLGSNELIGSVDRFVKTTPPGPGSQRFTLDSDNPIVAKYGTRVSRSVSLMHVGTYEAEDIGTSCYHVNLAILENLLSHAETGPQDWIVCDMVAGTDAFSNSLHAQFDAIAIIVEPTPESTGVARKYRELARAAGTEDTLVVVGNKVADSEDVSYLETETDGAVLTALGLQPGLRRARQRGERPRLADIEDIIPLEVIEKFARTSPHTEQRRTQMLYDIHRRLAQQDWIRDAHGDITVQIPVS